MLDKVSTHILQSQPSENTLRNIHSMKHNNGLNTLFIRERDWDFTFRSEEWTQEQTMYQY